MFKAISVITGSMIYASLALGQSAEIPNVKYPAAIVYEGGRGNNPWLERDSAKNEPIWRLYVCLENASKSTSGQVVLDLANLGTPIEHSWHNNGFENIEVTERLTKVVLNYNYQTQIVKDSEGDATVAFGKAMFEVQSAQTWELVDLAPEGAYEHKTTNDLSFFNAKISKDTLMHSAHYLYESGGNQYYLSTKLQRFFYNADMGVSNVIEVCEQANRPYVLQTGSDLTSK